MDFPLTETQTSLRDAARDFARREIAPLAAAMDRAERPDPELLRQLAELGYFGVTIPAEYGGSASDHVTTSLLWIELARACAGIATTVGASAGLFGGALAAHGTEAQRRRYLPGIAAGERMGCLAITEPQAGSDALAIRTRASKLGDRYVLNGAKTLITNAPIADVCLIYATLDPALGREGVAAFIVEADTPGFSAGPPFEKMGLRASPTGEIALEDCEVPAEGLLGMTPGRGLRQLLTGLNAERVGWSAIAVGIARAASAAAFRYAQEREQFGGAIYQFQLVQDLIARMSTDTTLAELACLSTARMLDQGQDVALAAAQCKLFTSEAVQRVTSDALQVHGGYGYMRDFPVEKYARDARVFAIGAGTSEIQKLLIAGRLLSRGIG
jgi:alkylation response protein AidB-like acyl-CoA dehydrogenase